MSDTEKDSEFYQMADAFIALANESSKKTTPGKVSATFLYGAARYNTFIVASDSESPAVFEANKDKAIEYFMAEYRKMLVEHFADYHENFEKYIGSKDNSIN